MIQSTLSLQTQCGIYSLMMYTYIPHDVYMSHHSMRNEPSHTLQNMALSTQGSVYVSQGKALSTCLHVSLREGHTHAHTHVHIDTNIHTLIYSLNHPFFDSSSKGDCLLATHILMYKHLFIYIFINILYI